MDEAEQVARIEEVVLPIIRGHGLELVDLEWRRVPAPPGRRRGCRPRGAGGRRVRCGQAGGHEVRGRLVAVEPDWLVLEGDGGEVRLPRATLTKARLEAEVP